LARDGPFVIGGKEWREFGPAWTAGQPESKLIMSVVKELIETGETWYDR